MYIYIYRYISLARLMCLFVACHMRCLYVPKYDTQHRLSTELRLKTAHTAD